MRDIFHILLSDTTEILDFSVEIKENDDSKRMNWKEEFVIRVTPSYIFLLEAVCMKTITKWSYYDIRKFGKVKHHFTLCTGRKTQTGEGIFEFQTKLSDVIVQIIESFVSLLQSQSSLISSPPNLFSQQSGK